MIIIDPVKDSRKASTDALRIHANYKFAERLQHYIEAHGDKCMLTRKLEGAPSVPLKSLVTNYAPEITIAIDCYNDNSPTASGFFIKTDAYSALVETIVYELSQLGLRPMRTPAYSASKALQYGTVADITIYLGFATNTQLLTEAEQQAIIQEQSDNLTLRKADVDAQLASASNDYEDADNALNEASSNLAAVTSKRDAAQTALDNASDDDDTQALQLDLDLATQDYERALESKNIAQQNYDTLGTNVQILQSTKEQLDLEDPSTIVLERRPDAELLADDSWLDKAAAAIIDGAYGPPVKTLRDVDPTGNEDPYFYHTYSWKEKTVEDGSSASIDEDTVKGVKVKYLHIDSKVVGYYPTDVDMDGDGVLDVPPPPEEESTYEGVPKHYTWYTPLTYEGKKDCYFIFSVKTIGEVTIYTRVGTTEFVQTLNKEQFTTIVHEVTINTGDIIELGVQGTGEADFTAVWVSPKGKIGILDDPRSSYSIFPPGYRASIKQEIVLSNSSSLDRAITTADTLMTRAQDKTVVALGSLSNYAEQTYPEQDYENAINAEAARDISATSAKSASDPLGAVKNVVNMAMAAVDFAQSFSGLLSLFGGSEKADASIQDAEDIVKNMGNLPGALMSMAESTIDLAEKEALLAARSALTQVNDSAKEWKERPTLLEEAEKEKKALADSLEKNIQDAKAKVDALKEQRLRIDTNTALDNIMNADGGRDAAGNLIVPGVTFPADLMLTGSETEQQKAMIIKSQRAHVLSLAKKGDLSFPSTMSAEATAAFEKQLSDITAGAESANAKKLADFAKKQELEAKQELANLNINNAVGKVKDPVKKATEFADKAKDDITAMGTKLQNMVQSAADNAVGAATSAIGDLAGGGLVGGIVSGVAGQAIAGAVDKAVSQVKNTVEVATNTVQSALSSPIVGLASAALPGVQEVVNTTAGTLSTVTNTVNGVTKVTTTLNSAPVSLPSNTTVDSSGNLVLPGTDFTIPESQKISTTDNSIQKAQKQRAQKVLAYRHIAMANIYAEKAAKNGFGGKLGSLNNVIGRSN